MDARENTDGNGLRATNAVRLESIEILHFSYVTRGYPRSVPPRRGFPGAGVQQQHAGRCTASSALRGGTDYTELGNSVLRREWRFCLFTAIQLKYYDDVNSRWVVIGIDVYDTARDRYGYTVRRMAPVRVAGSGSIHARRGCKPGPAPDAHGTRSRSCAQLSLSLGVVWR